MRIGRDSKQSGFTLIELMIVVAIIGLLAAIAIPNYSRFQLKSKTAEGKVNLAGIRTAEEAYFSEHGNYLSTATEPTEIPGTVRVDFDATATGYPTLGWQPEGRVFFSYGVAITADSTGYTVDAGADIDGNGTNQYWIYTHPGANADRATPQVGCTVETTVVDTVLPCGVQSGQSIF